MFAWTKQKSGGINQKESQTRACFQAQRAEFRNSKMPSWFHPGFWFLKFVTTSDVVTNFTQMLGNAGLIDQLFIMDSKYCVIKDL